MIAKEKKMLSNAYSLIMNPALNPLRGLPKPVRFQIMVVLAYMWSITFALWAGYLWLFGPSALAHTLLILALFATNEVFHRARSASAETSAA